MQPAELGDRLDARAEEQVVRVAEDHPSAEPAQLFRVDALDRRLRSDGHEGGRRYLAVRRVEDPGAGRTVSRDDLELSGRAQPPLGGVIAPRTNAIDDFSTCLGRICHYFVPLVSQRAPTLPAGNHSWTIAAARSSSASSEGAPSSALIRRSSAAPARSGAPLPRRVEARAARRPP